MLTMYRYPSLRVAYIDTREETINGRTQKVFYSVLLKGGDKLDEVCKNPLLLCTFICYYSPNVRISQHLFVLISISLRVEALSNNMDV